MARLNQSSLNHTSTGLFSRRDGIRTTGANGSIPGDVRQIQQVANASLSSRGSALPVNVQGQFHQRHQRQTQRVNQQAATNNPIDPIPFAQQVRDIIAPDLFRSTFASNRGTNTARYNQANTARVQNPFTTSDTAATASNSVSHPDPVSDSRNADINRPHLPPGNPDYRGSLASPRRSSHITGALHSRSGSTPSQPTPASLATTPSNRSTPNSVDSTQIEGKPRRRAAKVSVLPEFPPPQAVIPPGTPLEVICSDYPNHLHGEGLDPFLQWGWSHGWIFKRLREETKQRYIEEGVIRNDTKDKSIFLCNRLRVRKSELGEARLADLLAAPKMFPSNSGEGNGLQKLKRSLADDDSSGQQPPQKRARTAGHSNTNTNVTAQSPQPITTPAASISNRSQGQFQPPVGQGMAVGATTSTSIPTALPVSPGVPAGASTVSSGAPQAPDMTAQTPTSTPAPFSLHQFIADARRPVKVIPDREDPSGLFWSAPFWEAPEHFEAVVAQIRSAMKDSEKKANALVGVDERDSDPENLDPAKIDRKLALLGWDETTRSEYLTALNSRSGITKGVFQACLKMLVGRVMMRAVRGYLISHAPKLATVLGKPGMDARLVAKARDVAFRSVKERFETAGKDLHQQWSAWNKTTEDGADESLTKSPMPAAPDRKRAHEAEEDDQGPVLKKARQDDHLSEPSTPSPDQNETGLGQIPSQRHETINESGSAQVGLQAVDPFAIPLPELPPNQMEFFPCYEPDLNPFVEDFLNLPGS